VLRVAVAQRRVRCFAEGQVDFEAKSADGGFRAAARGSAGVNLSPHVRSSPL
jgi:hypothetical protein